MRAVYAQSYIGRSESDAHAFESLLLSNHTDSAAMRALSRPTMLIIEEVSSLLKYRV